MLRARTLLEAAQILCMDADVVGHIHSNALSLDALTHEEKENMIRQQQQEPVHDNSGSSSGGGGGGEFKQFVAYGQSINLLDIRSGSAWNIEVGPGGPLDILVVAQGYIYITHDFIYISCILETYRKRKRVVRMMSE
jgi:hypothetical protein